MEEKIASTKRVFIERQVMVMFGNEWEVIKLDEHRYYKHLSGQGISAVDFMAVHPHFGLALIELKNYVEGASSIPPMIDQIMLNKQENSIRLIKIVYKYYRRHFYFRLLTKIGWKKLYPKEWLPWIWAMQCVEKENYFFIGIVDY